MRLGNRGGVQHTLRRLDHRHQPGFGKGSAVQVLPNGGKVCNALHLRHQHRIGLALRNRGKIRLTPGRRKRIDADDMLDARLWPCGKMADQRLARRRLHVGRHRILEIIDCCIALQNRKLRQSLGIGGWQAEHGAARM